VRDAVDGCPEVPEDRDGFEDDDGCPDPDNDHDGIADAVDRCPDQAEVVNGVDDHDGCPDEGIVEVRGGRIVVEESIFFDTDSARIRERSRPVLAAIATILRGLPPRRLVSIQGHADHRGTDAYNFTLSFQRALAVYRELVALGFRAVRLRPLGYGRRAPVNSGATPADLARNRRVEIVVHGAATPGDAMALGGWLHVDPDGRVHHVAGPPP
jgi:outer membrane protein OmpA-like peptidoglycan-associated protein